MSRSRITRISGLRLAATSLPHNKQKEPVSSECSGRGECLNCILGLDLGKVLLRIPRRSTSFSEKYPEHWCYGNSCVIVKALSRKVRAPGIRGEQILF